VDIRGVAARHKLSVVQAQPDFDSLEMDQYNEVQSLTRALIEETTDARDLGVGLKDELAGLAGILHQQQRLMRELQHLTSQTRMAPVETIVPRLQRNVRQTAAVTHKQAQLVVVGHDILVDAGRAEPAHRSPVAHPAQRRRPRTRVAEDRETRGKPRMGTITLTVARRGQVVTVQVADDGRGLDLRDIRSRAVERGLLSAEAMPTDAEIARLTLLPGFSTRDMVTEISGRGVGLDVVATRLRALSGAIDIRSEVGRGLSIELRFQASLVATHCPLHPRRRPGVRHREPRGAHRDPAVAVKLEREQGVLVAIVDDAKYPAHELASLTGMRGASTPERRNLVLVDSEAGPIGVLVDAVLEANELVTRPTGKYLKRIPGCRRYRPHR
jgi:chemosensory pili system protein ChpA (sensor histidine kinase/response regulator)